MACLSLLRANAIPRFRAARVDSVSGAVYYSVLSRGTITESRVAEPKEGLKKIMYRGLITITCVQCFCPHEFYETTGIPNCPRCGAIGMYLKPLTDKEFYKGFGLTEKKRTHETT